MRVVDGSAVAAFGCLIVLSGTSNAAISSVSVTQEQLVPGFRTLRIFVNFDNATDNLLSVSGNSQIAGLEFSSTHALFQDEGPFEGLSLGDRPHFFDETGADSWVSIGGNWMAGLSDTSFSPGFLGGDGIASVINGTSFVQADNGGYFDSNPGTPETGSVIIAQFTLPLTTQSANFSGTVSYSDGSDIPVDQAFSASLFTPNPGALAVLSLTLFRTGTRTRRRSQSNF